MAEIICIIGNKGGTGKTTLSHMLCQGMGLLGQRSVCVLTDTHREPLKPEGRRYLVADARTREALGKVVDKLRALPGWLGVIDGGGNRSEMDRKLYSLANLVLLPFRDSHEDMRTLISDLETFPRAWAIPSQWPTNPWQQEAAEKTLREHLHWLRGSGGTAGFPQLTEFAEQWQGELRRTGASANASYLAELERLAGRIEVPALPSEHTT